MLGDDGLQESDEKCRWAGKLFSMDRSPPRDFSNTVRRRSLPAWSKAPGCPFSLLWPGSAVLSLPQTLCVVNVWFLLTQTHTPPLCTPTVQLLRHVSLGIYTLNSISAAHTHTHKVHGDILCSSCALLQQCACVSGRRLSPAPLYRPPATVAVLGGLVGAGGDGFLQLQVQGSRAELEAAVAGLTDATGLEQLLAWHWDLLVATAGAEHVTAVPAGGHREVTAGLSHTETLYTYS